MTTLLSFLDSGPEGLKFSIDLNTVMLALIAGLIAVIAWFIRKWGASMELQIQAIHLDMKAHNDKSDGTHADLYGKIHGVENQVSVIKGRLDVEED